jgi:hypothetical protein
MVAISLVSVYHHAQAVRYGYRLGRLQADSARLRQSLASLEGRVTMLASPSRLRSENDRLQLGLVAPSSWRDTEPAIALARAAEPTQDIIAR